MRIGSQNFDYIYDPAWRAGLVQNAFGKSFWAFLAGAVILGLICWGVLGAETVLVALKEDIRLLIGLMPRVLVALSIAALIWVLLPRDRMAGLVGKDSGIRGLVIATLAGTVTPGGPSSAYSLLAVLAVSGADRGALIAYITAWATLGMQRILIWDVPFMGEEFAFLRFMVSLPLPVLAGLLARKLPLTLTVNDPDAKKRGEA
ncbi:hypothetical protein [Ovoidimarina sediminis]|uniref:hypothetical protein n=1 Tax=Ovoidimarina sediminis TaxID=3079856 RepID=UPI00290FCEA9|nr:hypothetical protein [Rhodophyticola sp. MJ-SS7]MDU8941770.1 hypothetical protein [Rhodophyticola sp. MJ-SS7]